MHFGPRAHAKRACGDKGKLRVARFDSNTFCGSIISRALFFKNAGNFVSVRAGSYVARRCVPRVALGKLSVFNGRRGVRGFLCRGRNGAVLRLSCDRGFFRLGFVTVSCVGNGGCSFCCGLRRVDGR